MFIINALTTIITYYNMYSQIGIIMNDEFFDIKRNNGFAPGYTRKDLKIGRWIKVKFENPLYVVDAIIYKIRDYSSQIDILCIGVMLFENDGIITGVVDQTQIIEYGKMAHPHLN